MEINELLLNRLISIDLLRNSGGSWVGPLQRLIQACPQEIQKKINAFLSNQQRQNAKALETYLNEAKETLSKLANTPAENVKRGEETAFNLQLFGNVKALTDSISEFMTALEEKTNDALFDKIWDMLTEDED